MAAFFGAEFRQHVLARRQEETGALLIEFATKKAMKIAYRAEIVRLIRVLRDTAVLLPV
jgi:hypothetical protein